MGADINTDSKTKEKKHRQLRNKHSHISQMTLTSVPRPFKERIVLSTNGIGEPGYPHGKRVRLDSYLVPYKKLTQRPN